MHPRLHPHTYPLSCRPPGHPVQNVLPSTTSMAPLSKTFPSAKETCSPSWPSPRYLGTLDAYSILSPSGIPSGFGSPSEGGRPERVSGPSLQDPNWYKAKNKVGREGIIPANYVQKREGVKAGTKLSLMP